MIWYIMQIGANMQNPESHEQPTDYIAEIRSDIAHASELMQAEMGRTENPWTAALVTRLQVARGNAQLGAKVMQISEGQARQVMGVVDSINEKITYWMAREKNGETTPPEVKEELMDRLDSISRIFEQEDV